MADVKERGAMRLVQFTTVLILFLVILLPAILSFGVRYIPNDFQPSLDIPERVYNTTVVSNSLVGTYDNLAGVGVSIKNPNLANKKDINFSLYENGKLTRTLTLNGKSIGDGNFVKFLFLPIPDSKDKQYTFIFSAPGVNENEALQVFLTKERTVSFVSFYKPQNLISVMLSIYGNWFNKLVSELPFFATYLLLILGLGYLAIKRK